MAEKIRSFPQAVIVYTTKMARNHFRRDPESLRAGCDDRREILVDKKKFIGRNLPENSRQI